MKKRMFLILFVLFTFLISNNVYASECKYNEGGITCCKKYGKVRVSEGNTVEAICQNKINESDFEECVVIGADVTNIRFSPSSKNGKTKTSCQNLNGATFDSRNKKVQDCTWSNSKKACICNVYEKKKNKITCTSWKCPNGSKEVIGSTTSRGQKPVCAATTTTLVDGCVEYEEREAERVCPAYIEWGLTAEGQCSSKLGKYSDSLEWDDCVYNDETMKEEVYGDSAYCPVYCLESFNASVSNYTPSIKAGTNFTFPSSDNYLEGSRWCTTKYINYDKFLKDLEYANQKISSYYIDWKREELKEKIISEFAPSTTKNCALYCDYNVGEKCCKLYTDNAKTCDGVEKYPCTINGKKTTCKREYSYECPGCAIPDTQYYHGYIWSWKNTGSGHNEELYVDGLLRAKPEIYTWCGLTEEPPTAETEKYKRLYEQWLSRAKAIYNRMKNCYEWGDFTQEDVKKEFYNANPSVSLTYKGANGNIYTYEDALNVSTSVDITKDTEECVNTTVKFITGYDSNNNKIVKSFPIKKCTKREVQAFAYSKMSLKDDAYRYVNKANGQSFHANQLKSFGNSKYFNYIDVGYGNLPVGFATKPGVYGYSTGLGELSLTFSHIGHIDKNGNSKIEKVIEVEATKSGVSDYNKIYCDYKVTNGLVPSNPTKPSNPTNPTKPTDSTGGITLIYRLIDLYEPFPNIDGKGRNTGANWCDSNNCSNTNNVVKKYILNNRNVVGDEVYNLEPMYSFKLTPAIINRIREYNKNNAYDYDSTGMKTGMVCDKGKGTRCISDYLTELIEMTEATGTCTQNRKDTFDTCRY